MQPEPNTPACRLARAKCRFLYTPQRRRPPSRRAGGGFLDEQGQSRNASSGPDSLLSGEKKNGKSYRYRPRNDQFLRRRHGRQGRQGHRECRRRAHDALHRRLHRFRRASGRPAGEAPGGDQSRRHDLRGEAPDRPPLRRSGDREGQEARPLQDRQGRQWRCLGRGPGQEIFALADFRLHPAEDEGNRRVLSRREGREGGHHRSRLFQRRPAPGDQGRRQDRRASKCCASSTSRPRPRSPTGSTRRRPARSPSTTSAAAPSTSRCWRSATACSR